MVRVEEKGARMATEAAGRAGMGGLGQEEEQEEMGEEDIHQQPTGPRLPGVAEAEEKGEGIHQQAGAVGT